MKYRMYIIGLFAGMLVAPAYADGPVSAAPQRAIKLANELCITCHGPGGRSTNTRFPNLAAQQPQYIVNQLHNFQGHIRIEPDAHDFMWGIAAKLDEELINDLAQHYASQPPAMGKAGDAQRMAQGSRIFRNGIPERNVAACATCHGAEAKGNGTFPRLAGQHADYLFGQLQLIQNAVRLVPPMHDVVKNLSQEELRSLAVYLQSL